MWDLKRHKDKVAIIDDFQNQITYGELNVLGEEISDAVGGRCLVFALCTNTIGSVVGYVSFVNHGIVPALVSAHLDAELLGHLLRRYRPAYLWAPTEQKTNFSDAGEVYAAYGYSLLRMPQSAFGNDAGKAKDKAMDCDANQDGATYPMAEELCLLLTTSGSTGSPKFVRQSYTNVLKNAESIVEYLGITDSERPISTLPMNYTYGLSIINSHLLVGATLLMTEKGIMQKEFWSFFREQRATSFGGVPYTYEMLDKLRFYRMDLPSLRHTTQAGGKLSPELHRKFAENAAERGTKFVVMYGQCEATARMGYLPADKALEKCGSMGIAIPSGKFRLIDGRGNEITEPHTTGELVYEGPNVTLGYAECAEDLSKGDERRGILETGDMAQFDEDGYYYIVGRKKRFLKIYGNRVNLDEIDRMVKAEFDGLDCASAGSDDHMRIFVTDGSRAEEVRDFVAGKTGLNRAAFEVVTIDAIPKNDAGKTLYSELERLGES